MEETENSQFNLIRNKSPHPQLLPIANLKLHDKKKFEKKRVDKSVLRKKKSFGAHENDFETNILFKPKLPKSFYIIKLREWADEIPIIGLQPEWENNIMHLIFNTMKYRRYPQYERKLFEEIKNMYLSDMQQLAIESTVVKCDERSDNKINDEYDSNNYNTKNTYQILRFLKHRNILKNKYFLSHSFMRHIISLSISVLVPQIIVDFEYYHTIGFVQLSEIRAIIKNDLNNGCTRIKHKYYKQVVGTILKSQSLKKIPPNVMPQFMRCATNLFVQQILNLMMHTIKQMIHAMENNQFCPQIQFELVFENGSLTIKPSIEQVKSMYHEVIYDIEKVGQNLLSLNVCSINSSDDATTDEYMCIKLPDWFIRESEKKLKIVIMKLFKRLNNYYCNIVAEFGAVCAHETQESLTNLVAGDYNYDIYYAHIKTFDIYLKRANAMVPYLYYYVGRLSQNHAKESLKKNISNIIHIFVDKLVDYHMKYNRSIYREFDKFQSRALNIPNNAEALFELTENMVVNSKIIVDNLESKIKESVRMLIILLDITSLTDEHMKLNSKTLNCLSSMKNIFIQNNTLCEAMKSELEDDLQKKINTLNVHIDNIYPTLIILNDMDDANRVDEYIEYLKVLVANIRGIDSKIQSINMEERLFKFPETLFPKVNDIKNIVLPFFSLNQMINEWRRYHAAWLDGPFEYVNADKVEQLINFYLDQFTQLNKSIKANIKLDMATQKLFRFLGIIDDPDPMQQPAPMKLCFQALEQINKFKEYVSLINCICNNALRQRHWDEMSIIYGSDITPNAGTTLRKFIDLDLMKDMNKYHMISISANKELALQQKLESMYEQWKNISFIMKNDEMNRLTFVDFDEIQVRLDEHLIILQEMKGSYFVRPIAHDIGKYNESLIQIRDVINLFNTIQDECLFLRPIFADNTIFVGELVDVAITYFQVEEMVNAVKESILCHPTFHDVSQSSWYTIKLLAAMEKIEMINNRVCMYLNKMRLFFPRFFFLSDNDLIMILFKENGIGKVKSLFRKCFRGVENIKVNSSKTQIISIISDNNEELLLKKKIFYSHKHSNEWIKLAEIAIIDAIREDIYKCITSSDMISNGKLIIVKNCSIGITTECTTQLIWTSCIQKCFINFHPENLKSILHVQNSLINITINDLKTKSLIKERMILMSLATLLFHQREIINLLILNNVSHDKDFNWIAQLRYYWLENNVNVDMVHDSKYYGYEFSSITEPIINTLLTDRCYRTIIEAGRHYLFATLVGPAAVGKTETIRGLTSALAVPFHIINCSENLNCEQISKIFKGLIACGAWVCFKNINTVELTVLSAVTHHIRLISQILSSKCTLISFDGSQLILKTGGFIITTVNYHRSSLLFHQHEFPDNFRALFRSVAFRRPDISKICEARLFAAGFSNAKLLANKIQLIYKLCIEHYSSEKRYDFGCQALNTVLRSAVNLKFQFPSDNEDIIVLRSLIDVNLPMLSDYDIIVFQEFLHDVFPKVCLPPPNYGPFLMALDHIAKINGIQAHELFKLKMIQVLEMTYLRHIFMLIGDALVGKTTLLRTLAQCLSYMAQAHDGYMKIEADVQLEVINQKSITSDILFGYLDKQSSRWCDGIYTALLRNHKKNNGEKNLKKWIIFDGPVESIWMDNLNIILDNNNNRTLSLSTGESIRMPDSISVILETDNIGDASPAIVSRCGIIYLEQQVLGFKHYIAAWVFEQKFEDDHNEFLKVLIEWSLDSCLEFVYRSCQFIIVVEKIYLVTSTLKLCTIYLKSAIECMDEKDKDHFEIWYQAAVIQSIIWTFGSCLSMNSRALLNEFCVLLWSNNDITNPVPGKMRQCELSLPSESMIQDNTFIFKGTGFWKHWGDILKDECAITQAYKFGFTFVPTIDTIKHIFMFNNHIKYRIPFIVCGDTSTGKTTLMRFFLNNKLSNSEYMTNFFNFSPTTVACQAQHSFILKLNRIMGDHYASTRNKLCINFIDDISAGITAAYDERKSLLELIRQYIDHGHWYNLNKPTKLVINDIIFLCALTSNEVARERILYSRFLSHFNLYTLCIPTRESIMKIFSNTLFYNLKKNLFTADVIGSVNSIVSATIDIYTLIIKELKPIPTNIQYHFSIRDISKVINGCSLIHKESVETKVTLIRLWVHESIRVFGDRITNGIDSEWFFSNMKRAINVHFKDSFDSIFDHLPKENNQLTQESFKNIIFTNFMEADRDANNRRYEEVSSTQQLKNRVIYYLNELHNKFDEKLDILLFSDVLEHLIRVCRILSIPSGNLLMICTGGLGRKSLTRLAAYIERQDFFQCTSSHYFDLNKWREDLKCMVKHCAGVGKQCVFFIPARYIKDTHFEDISSLMATGEIPHLISPDERQTIVEIARLSAQNGDRNLEMSIMDIMEYFFNQCRENLHFILYFNMTNCSSLRRQIQLCPSLLKYSYIDYFTPWPLDAFLQLGTKFIDEISVESIIKEKIIIAGKYFYDQSKEISAKYYNRFGRLTYISPSAFIHMMRLYTVKMSHKQQAITASRNKYLGGLKKLELAAKEVTQMQEILTALRPELELSARKTEETMREIENENVSVENATIQVKKDEEIANKTAEIAATLKSECEADLAVAIPILEDAIAALNTLKPSDITLVKAMKNPPDTVKLVMAAVCVMLDVTAERIIDPITGRKSMDFWGPSKRVLGDMNFLQTLKDYDKDNISSSLMQIIKKTYMTDKNFMPHIVTKASSAAEGLCKWVRAMVSYDEVAKIVAPKKEKLAAAEKECNECLAFLNEKRKTLAALNDKLTALKSSLQDTLAKKFRLEKEVTICMQKLVKAEALITSLGDEKSKWMQSADKLKQSYGNLAGDILLSCAIVAYLAPYHSAYRNDCVTLWVEYIQTHLNITCTNNYNFVECLESEIKISYWHQCGLSRDNFTRENAVILNNSLQLCLFIDPQSQANVWIREMERHNQLIIIKLSDPNYLQNIVRGIELDQPVLVENIDNDEFSALSIDCILSRIMNNYGNNYDRNKLHYHMTTCDITGTMKSNSVGYNSKFRVYMTSLLENSHFNSHIFSKITVIDFQLTEEALQNKLLDIVISHEKPEVHEKFDRLLDNSASNMRLLKQEEDNILTILSSSTVNILQDDKSIKILDISKNVSVEIIRKEKCVNIAKNKIDIFRQSYSEFTRYCAVLYNTLSPLSNLNCMYRFSLRWFMQLFIESIVNSRRSAILQKRLEYLISSFTILLHSNVLIALSNKHKLLYSFLICLKIQVHTRKVTSEEIDFFMSDNSNVMSNSDVDMSIKPNWLSEYSWRKITILSKNISSFRGLETSIKTEESLWLRFYNSENPENYFLPPQWQESLTPLQKLIIIKEIRPDRTVIEIAHFISITMGQSFLIDMPRNLSHSYPESSCLIPLIFILPSYIEPLRQVQEFAATKGYTSKLTAISLGNYCENRVRESIAEAQKHGGWVLLENCHLANTWMLQLEKIYETIDTSNTALGFRLWLSSAPTRQFPISILQNGIKIMYDTPSSLKQTLIDCYHSDPLDKPNVFASCPGKDKILSKLIYALTFFHIIVKERNYFGINGWNINYDFCHSDLTMSISQLQTFIKNDVTISFEALLYFVGECNYGGKLLDDIDNRCIMTIFHAFCNPDVIIQDNYSFSLNYNIPDRCERHDYIKHIKNLPDHPTSLLFGISENSMINRNTLLVNDFMFQISQLNGWRKDDKSLSKENISAINVETLRNNLPIALDIEEAKRKCPKPDLLDGILIHEISTYNSILNGIEKSLMQTDDEFDHTLAINTIPALWYFFPNFSQHQISLSKFISNINEQYNFFNKWIIGECSKSFWLGIFASPKRFISITRIMLARHYDIPVDQLVFDFPMLPINDATVISSSDEKALYLHGLFLTGANWDAVDGRLAVSNPRILSERMPVIRWKPQFSKEKSLQYSYSCPLYKSNIGRDLVNYAGDSSNFIIQILLPTNLHHDYWIKRGTSLFCQVE